jgi:hypothetical protein
MSYPVTARFHPLDNMVANGMTHFKRARKGWIEGKYSELAINPFSLRAVKFLHEPQFIYICPDEANADMPVIRINRQQLVTFPFDELTQLRFANWFYDCLRTGVRKPFYETYEPMIIDQPTRAKPTKQKKPEPETRASREPACAPAFYELERTKTIVAVGSAKRILAQKSNNKQKAQAQQPSAHNPTKITNRVGMGSFGGFKATGRRQTQTRKTKRAILRDLKTGDYLAEDIDSDYYNMSARESGADFGDVCTGAYSASDSETESDLSDFIVPDDFVEFEDDY